MDAIGPRYLDLMKKALTCSIYADQPGAQLRPLRFPRRSERPKRLLYALTSRALRTRNLHLVGHQGVSSEAIREGREYLEAAFTMVGTQRLENLQFCCEEVLRKDIAGDFVETGVWRGGAAIFMRAILKVHGVTDRIVWLADSFAGLPPPDPKRYSADDRSRLHKLDWLRVPLEQVQSNFAKFDLLDDQVRFLKGWFSETLPSAPIKSVAVLRLDGDMYESTMDALRNLYPRVSRHGFVIIDDYALRACRQAVSDFRTQNGITDEIKRIDWTGVYWQRD